MHATIYYFNNYGSIVFALSFAEIGISDSHVTSVAVPDPLSIYDCRIDMLGT
jgi:hypothetical protein